MGNFIVSEKLSRRQENIRSILRFIWHLKMLRWFLFPSLITILMCAGIPQYFLWAMGKYVSLRGGGSGSLLVTHHFLGYEVSISLGLRLLAVVVSAAFLMRVLSWGFFELSGKWSTQTLHRRMVKAVSSVRTTFFDENPSGRIINRMTGDFLQLSWAIILSGDTANSFAEIMCVGLLIMVADPVPALLVLPLLFCYLFFQSKLSIMLSHARELKSVALGEVMHRQTDLIDGRDLFLQYQKEKSLVGRMQKAYERSIHISLLSAKIQWWGEVWLGFITVFFAAVVYLFLTIGIHGGTIAPVLAAIIITAVLNLSDMFGFLTWNLTHLGESAANVRRVHQFVDLPDEVAEERVCGPHRVTNEEREKDPSGDIRFVDFSMSYRPHGPLILKHLNMSFPWGKKTGVVGRTGCGKTSLFQALFRMVYVAGGDIRIGNRSIYSMEMNRLRSLFGVVPQDPYLFSGTLRYNLSGGKPFISDGQMMNSMEKVGLSFDLDRKVLEGGRDFSMGERQLICLARLILLEKPIIVMDEPTSSVDFQTETKIRSLLDDHFRGKTIVTISHRLESLYGYDHIVEMEEGAMVRTGPPETMIPLIGGESRFSS